MQLESTPRASSVAAALFTCVTFTANADAITDWNLKAAGFITESKLGTPPAIRAMAIVQTAVHEAVKKSRRALHANARIGRCRGGSSQPATLSKLMPTQQAAIDTAYQAALAQIAEARQRPRASRSENRPPRQCSHGAATTALHCGVTSSAHDRRCLRADGRHPLSRSGRSANRGRW